MHKAWPKAHRRAPPDLAIRQRPLCSGARPSAQPYVAYRDKIGIASDHFKVGSEDPLPESLPPKNRACAFTAHGSRITRASYREAGFTTSKPRL